MLALSFDRGIDSSESKNRVERHPQFRTVDVARGTWPSPLLHWACGSADVAEMRAELGPAAACGLDRLLVRNRRPTGLGHLRRFRSLVRWCSAVAARWRAL